MTLAAPGSTIAATTRAGIGMVQIWFVPALSDPWFKRVSMDICRRELGLMARQRVGDHLPIVAVLFDRDVVCQVSASEAEAAENAAKAEPTIGAKWETGYYLLEISPEEVTERLHRLGIEPTSEIPGQLG